MDAVEYGLPELPENRRWYLGYYTENARMLRLQEKRWWGWRTIGSEITVWSKYTPFEQSIRENANKILARRKAQVPHSIVVK